MSEQLVSRAMQKICAMVTPKQQIAMKQTRQIYLMLLTITYTIDLNSIIS